MVSAYKSASSIVAREAQDCLLLSETGENDVGHPAKSTNSFSPGRGDNYPDRGGGLAHHQVELAGPGTVVLTEPAVGKALCAGGPGTPPTAASGSRRGGAALGVPPTNPASDGCVFPQSTYIDRSTETDQPAEMAEWVRQQPSAAAGALKVESIGSYYMNTRWSPSHPGKHLDGNPLPSAYVVEQRDNPSSSYYVMPALDCSGHQVKRFDLETLPEACESGTSVVFVRYISRLWRRWVTQHRDAISRLVLFMDDDLLDWHASKQNSWGYRRKLWRLTAKHRAWLHSNDAELWVSTPYLADKYSTWPAHLILPQDIPSSLENSVRVFYHGSGTHRLEVQWLDDVMRKVSKHDSRILFELIGGPELHKTWRWHSNVIVVHPMSWPAYQSFCSVQRRDIGLAPLLGGPFNAARSHTKFFDITRCGAVGIYSRHPAYTDAVRDQKDGILLNNDADSWAKEILRLAGDKSRQSAMLASAQQRVAVLSEAARYNNRTLFADF